MDVLSAILDGPRARDAFLLRALLAPPWCVRVRDACPLEVIVVQTGHAWAVPDDGPAVELRAGDVAVVRSDVPWTLCDQVGREPTIVVHPGQRCETTAGRPLNDDLALGVRSWGTDPAGATTLLIGAYSTHRQVTQQLLDLLPRVAVLNGSDLGIGLLDLLDAEVARQGAGQEAVLDRLLDVVLITWLRRWFDRDPQAVPGWYAAYRDPRVGPVVRLLHDHPELPWTVTGLAARAGMSRAAFARRFTEVVGEPPATHLTAYRLAVAADLLCEPGSTLAAVARRVGYASPYALSVAFTRRHGVTPSEYRQRSAAVP